MPDLDQIRYITSALFFNEKGYVTEDELSNIFPNWRTIVEFIETIIDQLGLSIKIFSFKGQKCYAVSGFFSDYDSRLSDKESLMLVDFIIRFEIINPGNQGIEKVGWRKLIVSKLGGTRRSFSDPLTGLIRKGLLETKGNYIGPGWRYYASLNVENLKEQIKLDAKLNSLIQEEKKERGIID